MIKIYRPFKIKSSAADVRALAGFGGGREYGLGTVKSARGPLSRQIFKPAPMKLNVTSGQQEQVLSRAPILYS